ncbi:hypothetical protein J2S77_000922 [Alkalibacillus salilacus]|uniref:Uncharacterized protein n=1 Tax=Alkalibacillus salilacus TaxID=284582 RepID=A0ABT9VDE2_9BACI|nr:hypothetical protein [Alkalibacillus salilacus]
MMFPQNPQAQKWTLTEIDQLDVHFFYSIATLDQEKPKVQKYINDVF